MAGLLGTGRGVIDHDWLPSINRSLRGAVIVMMFAGYGAMTTTHVYSSLLLLLPAAVALLMPVAEWADRNLKAYRTLSLLATVGVLALLPYFVPAWGLLGAVTGLVIYIQVYLMLHDKQERQYAQIFLMNFFLLITACVQSPDPAIGLIMVVFLMSAVFGFLLLQAWAELRRKRAAEDAALTESGLSRRSPSRIVIMGPRSHAAVDQQRGAPRSTAMLGSVLGISLACVALTVLVFVGTPRLEAGMLGRSTNFNNITVGLPDDVNLMGGGNLQQSGTAVMHVRFPDEPGFQYDGEMFWRSTALDQYTGQGWGRVGVDAQYRLDPGPLAEYSRDHEGALVRSRGNRQQQEPVRQVIFMDNVPREGVPALPIVRRIASPTGRFAWDDARDGTVVVPQGVSTSLQYEVFSNTVLPEPEALRESPDNYSNYIPATALAVLLSQDLLPETRALVDSITANADTVYDKAVAIEAYLQSPEFIYSLQVPLLPAQNPIDAFINDIRVGHCELYASAMALMLRHLGVPTRVVKGFRGGEWDADGEAYTVLSDMAHLWVEVYFIGHGWIPFDPSPSGEIGSLSTFAAFNRMFSVAILRSKMLWYQNVVGFETFWRLEDLRAWRVQAIPDILGLRGQTSVAVNPLARYWPSILGSVGFLFCLVIFVRSFGGPQAGEAFRVLLTPDQRRARKLFLRFEEQLRALGIPETAQGGTELLEALAEKRDSLTDDAAGIVKAYQDARFGGRSLSRARYVELARAVRTLRAAARKSA